MPLVPSADNLLVRLRATEAAFARDARRQSVRWRYRLDRRRILFDREARAAHRRFRQSIAAFLRESTLTNALTAPLIYSLAVPLVLADAWITLYQWICFPLYGIARVPRRDYFVVDRHKLAYLNAIEKVHCTFCSYANGMIAYIREIAARTEQYWCPIKHGGRVRSPHAHYPSFPEYGDAAGYRAEAPALRAALGRPRALGSIHGRRTRPSKRRAS
jgi:hypothetical protein